MDGTWTIGELAERAAAALGADGAAQVSGRVRDLPNARLIRWYTTIGLVDPPLGRRGRTALYGPRHLLQLVAVKRRQAEGRSIAEIQLELAAAPDETLARIAALPAGPAPRPLRDRSPARPVPQPPRPTGSPSSPAELPVRSAGRPGEAAEPAGSAGRRHGVPAVSTDGGGRPAGASGPAGGSADAAGDVGRGEPGDLAGEGAEATARPAESSVRGGIAAPVGGSAGAPSTDARDAAHGGGERGDFWSVRPDVSYGRATVSADYGKPLPPVVQGVRLAPGLTLLLDGPALDDDDLAAIDSAARPLLDELHRRGLLTPAESPAFPPEAHFRRST